MTAMTSAERQRRYRERHPDRAKKSVQKWAQNNRDRLRLLWADYERKRSADHIGRLLREAARRAKARGLEFELLRCDLTIPDKCPVLGIPIIVGLNKLSDNSPSLDRIDNTLGYTKQNAIIVSLRANRLKRDATIDELRMLAEFYCTSRRITVDEVCSLAMGLLDAG